MPVKMIERLKITIADSTCTKADGTRYTHMLVNKLTNRKGETIGYQLVPADYDGTDPYLVTNVDTLTEAREKAVGIFGCHYKVAPPPVPKMKMREYPQNKSGYRADSARK